MRRIENLRPLPFPMKAAMLLVLMTGAACKGGKQQQQGGMVMPVHMEAAATGVLREKAQLVGTLEAELQVDVRSQIAGTVESVGFAEGERVEAGRVLFRIDESKLQASLREANADVALKESEFQRAKQLRDEQILSAQDFDRAREELAREKARADLERQRLKDARVTASSAGLTGARLVDVGQVVSVGQVLTTLTEASTVFVAAPVPEQHAAALRVGLRVEASVAAWPGEKFPGEVYFVSPTADPVTRTLLVKARIPNADGRLKPGMFTQLDLIFAEKAGALTIPEKAVVVQGGATLVVRVGEGDVVAFQPVKTGLREDGRVEILEGLQAGDRVVTEGHQKLFPGAQVRDAAAPVNSPKP